MQVIIISGQAKSGKSYLAQLIAEAVFKLGYIPILDNFASPIKEEASKVGLDKEKDHLPFRKFCQQYGRMKRIEDPDFFVKEAARRLVQVSKEEAEDISKNRKHWERVVIFDDCRYPNECKFGKSIDAVLAFVTRGDALPEPAAEWRDHESEHMSRIIDSSGFESHFDEVFDVFILNDGSKKQLNELVKGRVDSWLSVNQPNFWGEGHEECDCPLCIARKENSLPDPSDVMNYIIRKLTGQDVSPEQLSKLYDQLEDYKGPPSIDIDFLISFEYEEEDEDEEV